MEKWFIFGFALFLAGCSSGFSKPGAEYTDFYQDLTECEQQHTPDLSVCIGAQCAHQHRKTSRRRNQCMMARGWEITKRGDRFFP